VPKNIRREMEGINNTSCTPHSTLHTPHSTLHTGRRQHRQRSWSEGTKNFRGNIPQDLITENTRFAELTPPYTRGFCIAQPHFRVSVVLPYPLLPNPSSPLSITSFYFSVSISSKHNHDGLTEASRLNSGRYINRRRCGLTGLTATRLNADYREVHSASGMLHGEPAS
jgi:hypothetical protein